MNLSCLLNSDWPVRKREMVKLGNPLSRRREKCRLLCFALLCSLCLERLNILGVSVWNPLVGSDLHIVLVGLVTMDAFANVAEQVLGEIRSKFNRAENEPGFLDNAKAFSAAVDWKVG